MSNTTISPNMGLPIPTTGVDPSPAWANDINACLNIIDQHNHTPGQGEPIPPAGLNLNSALTFNGNDATNLRSTRFSSQGSPLAASSDLGCLYVSGADLFFNDENGNQVRITQSGSVTGSAGTITGLPSGTASAAFATGTFTFQSATSTPAQISVGPIAFGQSTAGAKQITLVPNAGIAANYTLTFPATAPANHQFLTSDGAGNLSWSFGQVQLGMVLPTFPNLTGAYSCSTTTAADTSGFVKCNGGTIVDSSSPMNGQTVPNINNSVFIQGAVTSGTTGGAASVTLSTANLAAHTHGAGSYATSVGVTGGTASLTGTQTFSSATHTHTFGHTHAWGGTGAAGQLFSYTSNDPTQVTPPGGSLVFAAGQNLAATGATAYMNPQLGLAELFTTGVLSSAYTSGSGASAVTATPSGTSAVGISSTAASLTGSNSVTGTSASTGSATSFSILPTYISAIYVMRIK